MSQPVPPWAATANYPVLGAGWDNTLTKVTPAYSYFTPGQTPTAQELNAMFNARDLALASVSATSASDAIANWGPLNANVAAGIFCYGITYDPVNGMWLALLSNPGASIFFYYSIDGRTWLTDPMIGTIPNQTYTPDGIGVYPATGTFVFYQANAGGPTGYIVRQQQTTAAPNGVATSQAWAVRGGVLCNQGAFAYFYGANTPAMYFFGTSGSPGGVAGAWTGFCASDSADGAGAPWADLHASLPGSFQGGTAYVSKFEIAQSSNTMIVAICGGVPSVHATGASFLMKIDAAGTMTDITPSFVTGTTSIRGVGYSAADGLWGVVVTQLSVSPTTATLWISPDLVTWTQIAVIPAIAIAMSVVRDVWAILVNTGAGSAALRVVFMSGLQAAYQANTPIVAPFHYANYTDNLTTGEIATLVSSETPTAQIGNRQIASAGLFAQQSLVLSNKSGYFDQRQAGLAPATITPGWNTGLDLDFSKLGSGTFAADGSQTIGGFVWTKGRSANDRAALANVNGAGLRWQPTANRAGSYLMLPFTSFLPANVLLWSTSFRVFLYFQAQNFTNDGDNFRHGLMVLTALPVYEVIYGMQAGPVGFVEAVAAPSPATQTQVFAGAPGASTNVVVVDVPGLGSGTASVLAGQYNSGQWPTEASSLLQATRADCGSANFQDPSVGGTSPSSISLGLYPTAAAASAALTVTIGRIRVDFKL